MSVVCTCKHAGTMMQGMMTSPETAAEVVTTEPKYMRLSYISA